VDTILYAGQLAAGLAIIAAAGVALLITIEIAWWIYAKATGRDY
jgi:hypothetical protein